MPVFKSVTKRQFLYGGSAVALAALAPHAFAASSPSTGAHAMNPLASPLLLRKADALRQKDIFAWLQALRGHPYVVQSGFDVTSVFKVSTPEGMYYVGGVNVENAELTTGTCGEEGAIATAIAAFGQDIDIVEGWVMGAPSGAETGDIPCYPCGECRQRIAQYAAPHAPIHMIGLNGKKLDTQTRGALLPNAFSFRDLEHNNGASAAIPVLAPVEDITHRLFREPETRLTDAQVFQWLSGLRADVRVSGYNEMTVWRLANGAYIAGVKVENAAYPSSTNVMAAAAAVMNTRYGRMRVEEVWAYGFHNDAARQAPKHYLPSGASLQVVHAFAVTPHIRFHAFTAEGMAKSAALAELLPAAPAFTV